MFLPIVERELRVSARKRSTFWVRIIAALVALVIGGGFLVLTTVGFGFGTATLGRGLFAALTWLCMAGALCTGLFFTADCLSEEKREGTLGFLFLTDLRGYDVVLGKLAAMSLRAFYALLAVFPIFAIPLLMGGVTGAQFWKTMLALGNSLFVSLAVGLFVSAISRDSQKAMTGTLLLLLLLTAGGPSIDAALAGIKERTFQPVLSLSSAVYLLSITGAWGKAPFWTALLANQAAAWLLLALACVLLPRTWQERTAKLSGTRGSWAEYWKFGGARSRRALRRKLIEPNPIVWLACRERWQSLALWVEAILVVGGTAAMFALEDRWQVEWTIWNSFIEFLTLALYLGIASQAGRLLVEAKRSGFFELLLSTPLTGHQVVQGLWRAWLRKFALPLALFLAAQSLGSIQAQRVSWSRLAAMPVPPPAAPAGTNTNTSNTVTGTVIFSVGIPAGTNTTVATGGFAAPHIVLALAVSVASTLTIAANLLALIWFGMWMGMTSKNTSLATLKTLAFVQVIPWFAVSFAAMLAVPLLLFPRLMKGVSTQPALITVWFTVLMSGVSTVLYLVKDAVLVLWARRKLYSEFRERAARAAGPVATAAPPPLPRTGAPPVIVGA